MAMATAALTSTLTSALTSTSESSLSSFQPEDKPQPSYRAALVPRKPSAELVAQLGIWLDELNRIEQKLPNLSNEKLHSAIDEMLFINAQFCATERAADVSEQFFKVYLRVGTQIMVRLGDSV